MGKRDVESALQRLDVLTQRELQMVTATNLEVTHGIDDNVKTIEEITGIILGDVKVLKDVTRSVDNNVRAIREGA